MKTVQRAVERITKNIKQVIFGKEKEIQLILLDLLCEGHLLIEDVPGVGKTMLARALAQSLGCTFSRIQFTPDLLPSDVTGVSIYNQKAREFEFRPGPILSQIVLADEVNRATPKTQSALLEAMGEQQVTVDGTSYPLPRPFLVLATQNPIEYEGTFPLPEAQIDRFLVRIHLGYPREIDEVAMIDSQQYEHPLLTLDKVLGVTELREIQKRVREVYVNNLVKKYIVRLVHATRTHPDVYLGASPRGSLALYKMAQARAAIFGRDYVIPDDIKELAKPTLAHRLIIGPAARLKDVQADLIIEELLHTVPVPRTPSQGQQGR
ncbi:MAG: MoxR family ATPase [Chloroflexi bacterium]|nr:MoxR family ATPase [Chloroflexota bacterium]